MSKYSKTSEDIYNKDWVKMSKLILTISDAIKGYYKTSGQPQSTDYEVLLMSMQVFSLICGKKWGYSSSKIQEIWDTSQDVYDLVQSMSADTKVKGELQKPSEAKPKQYFN